MQEHPPHPHGRENSTLATLGEKEHAEVMRRWRRQESGMDGVRGLLPDEPDDLVAHRLLEAAGEAISRGEWWKGVTILQLVVKDYRQSQEAACARSVIDRLGERAGNRGR